MENKTHAKNFEGCLYSEYPSEYVVYLEKNFILEGNIVLVFVVKYGKLQGVQHYNENYEEVKPPIYNI